MPHLVHDAVGVAPVRSKVLVMLHEVHAAGQPIGRNLFHRRKLVLEVLARRVPLLRRGREGRLPILRLAEAADSRNMQSLTIYYDFLLSALIF